jgi:hypothetical protein
MIVFSSARVLRQIAVKSMSNYAYTPRSATPSNLDKSHCNRQNRVFTGLYTMIYKTVKPVISFSPLPAIPANSTTLPLEIPESDMPEMPHQ